jgi:hypothetical protein
MNAFLFLFLFLAANILRVWGRVVYRWKGLENTFLIVYYTPPTFKFAFAKLRRKNHSHFAIVDPCLSK